MCAASRTLPVGPSRKMSIVPVCPREPLWLERRWMNPAFSKPAMAAGKSSRCSRRSTSGVLRTAASSARETQAAADVVHGVTHANPGDRSKDGSHRRHLLANVPWIRGFCLKLSCSTQRWTFFNRAYGRWSWRYFFGHNVPRIPLLSRSPRTLLS